MLEYQKLESEKYLRPVISKDERLVQKIKRQQARSRFYMICLFAGGATLGYFLCTGRLGNLDVIGAIERIGWDLPFIG